ncbi:MAG TPA: hydrogenase maturation protease [Anaerohalosphaeraceae bacterium]|nr:hydrogenase maturation protease [Anaerohalosphaeraceae bacterium]
MTQTRTPILVLGIGNILLRDEGIGVRVIEALQQQQLPAQVELVDGGTAGADLLDILSDRQIVIIVDAAVFDAPPGTLLKFSSNDLLSPQQTALSLHDLDIVQTLTMTHLLKCPPAKVIFLGIVPETIEPGLELSQTLQQKLTYYIQTIFQELSVLTT